MKKKVIFGLIILFFLLIYFIGITSIPQRVKELFKKEQISVDSKVESINNPQINNSLELNKSDTTISEKDIGINNPIISPIPNIIMIEGLSYSASPQIDLDNFIKDNNNPDSEITWSVSNNINIRIDINPVTHIATLTAPPDWNGSEIIRLRATNQDGLFDEENINVIVRPIENI